MFAFALAVELKRIGADDRAFIDQHVLGYEAFMARAEEWPLEMVAAECGIKTEDSAHWLAGWPMPIRSLSRPATASSVAAMAAAVSVRQLPYRR